MTNENREIIVLSCEVVRDLLPLYADGLVSEKTAKAVDMHLEDCGDCRKEYELINTALPVDEKRTTAMKFADMMHRMRIRRLLTIIIVAALSCSVLAGAFWGLTQVPVRHIGADKVSIEHSHLYEDEEGTGLFLWYKVPMWTSPTFQNMYIVGTAEPGVWELKYEYKVAVLSKRFGDGDEGEYIWSLPIEADFEDVKAVIFEGKTIWNAEDAQELPDYVAAYRDFSSMNGRFNGMTIDADKKLIGFANAEDRYYIYWDIDGNLIYEGDGTGADKVIDFDQPDNPQVTGE